MSVDRGRGRGGDRGHFSAISLGAYGEWVQVGWDPGGKNKMFKGPQRLLGRKEPMFLKSRLVYL